MTLVYQVLNNIIENIDEDQFGLVFKRNGHMLINLLPNTYKLDVRWITNPTASHKQINKVLANMDSDDIWQVAESFYVNYKGITYRLRGVCCRKNCVLVPCNNTKPESCSREPITPEVLNNMKALSDQVNELELTVLKKWCSCT